MLRTAEIKVTVDLDEANDKLAQVRETILVEHADEITAAKKAYDTATESLDEVRQTMNDLGTKIQQEMQDRAPTFKISTPDLDAEPDDEPLLDSTRDYLDQMEHYKAFRDGEA